VDEEKFMQLVMQEKQLVHEDVADNGTQKMDRRKGKKVM
jgi:hypothetical protein